MHDFTDARSNRHAQSRQSGGEPMAHYGSEGVPNHGIIDHSKPRMQSATIQAAPYGSDFSGLVCGFRFVADEPGTPIDSSGVVEWLSRADAAKEFLWLHFDLANSSSERWMRARLDLPDAFFDTLRDGSHSTRIEHQEGALIAVINDVIFNFELTPAEIATLWVYTHQRLLVTARLKPLRSVDTLRESVRRGEVFRSPAELLTHLLRDQADLLVQIVRRTNVEVDGIEDRFLSMRAPPSRSDLGAMRRVLVRLQRLLAPEPGSVFRLLARPPRWLHLHDVQDLRDATEEFSLVLGDLAGLVERIKLLQEEIGTRMDEQSNRTLFTLTLVTVLALPINIVAGFFGMNVGGIPFAENHHGFWLMVLIVASFTVLAGWWLFRRRRDR
ncbi:Mg2 transporter protein CorA family protein [Caballeronia telluris]|uniref:Mg2 transporter protein CorA family protein n=2 Tax=Caballeronia telluris TaxID=326475 RepID=A0A158EZP7_9BURK|nr:Mg2 transporter protein CorA family protein [Caballeronia telluris]